jgi:tetratricopeptide (TPR) repeat protein
LFRRLGDRGSTRNVLAASLAVAGTCLACAPRPAPPAGSLEVYFHGCGEVRASHECMVPEGSPSTLKLWVKTQATAAVQVLLDGRPTATQAVAVQGGLRLAVAIDHAPVRITVRSPDGEWMLRVLPSAALEPFARAERLRASGDFAAARSALDAIREHPDIGVRAKVLGVLGRISLAQGSDREAIADLEQSIRMNRAAGSVSGEMNDRYVLSDIKKNEGDYAAAQDLLAGVRELTGSYPAGALSSHYYEGNLSFGTADFRRALASFDQASIDAERLGFERLWASATLMRMQTLHQLGRDADARSLIEPLAVRIPHLRDCARAEALELLGPRALELRQSAADLERVGAWLAEAVELHRRTCRKPRWHASSLVLLGFVRLAENQADEAARLLVASRAAYSEPSVRLLFRQLELDAMISEARRERSAEPKYRRIELLGLKLEDPLMRWTGLLGRGLALERVGRTDAAIDVYEEAETVLEHLRFNVPLGGGREAFLGSHRESASRLIELLLRRGGTEEALRVARRSRARSLSALALSSRLDAASETIRRAWYAAVSGYQQRRTARERDSAADWELPADELEQTLADRARLGTSARDLLDEALAQLGSRVEGIAAPLVPATGELVLLYHPVPSGWVGFAVTREGVIARRLRPEPPGSQTPDALGDWLLGPFSALIERSDRMRVLAFGTLNQIDFHALPWKGRPLIASIAVRYGVDVPRAVRSAEPGMNALIVTPHDELKSSAAEAAIAEQRLQANGWSVQRLRGSAVLRTTIGETITAGRIRLFHYSGHARFVGLDGWESHLGSDENQLMTVGDILTLPASPDYVILSGCETAASAGRSGSGLGIAQAFVIAGAHWVVASNRVVKDADAARIVTELVDQPGLPSSDVGFLLQAAQRKLLETRPEVDWASFRVLVP